MAMAEFSFSTTFSPEEVSSFLKKEVPGISQSILESLSTQKIDGEVFLELDEEYLREFAPLVGDRLKLKKAIRKATSIVSKINKP